MNENKTSKYLKYAIGEILLVVIGILIALQINNWNQNSQNRQKVDTLLGKILKDIEIDINEVISITKFYATKDSLARLVLSDALTAADYQQPTSMNLHALVTNYSEINLRINSYNNLMNSQDIIPEEYDAVLEQLALLYNDHYNYAEQAEDKYRDGMDNYSDYLFENYDWYFTQDYFTNTDRIDFYLNNVRYKGMVEEYLSSAIHNYLRFNINYAMAAIDTYKLIHEALQNTEIKSLVDFAKDSTILGNYRTIMNEDFELISDGQREYALIGADTVNLFQYDTNKFFMQSNFVRMEKVNDTIKMFVGAFENGGKPFATKLD